MIAVAVVALIIAGLIAWNRDPEVVELATPPERANTDHEILDLVLTDFIDYCDLYPAVGSRAVKKSQIVVGDRTWGYIRKDFPWVTNHEWFRAGKIPSDVVDDLAARNPKGRRFSFSEYRPSNPAILVRDLRTVDLDVGYDTQFPSARAWVMPRIPGYSRDGQTAVFSFNFGPTPHGAGGFYLLKKLSRRWEIVDRSVYYFD